MPSIAQSVAVSPRRTAWLDAVTLQQVDPALGIQSLALSLTGTVTGTVDITNLDLLPVAFEADTSGAILLARPFGPAWLTTSPLAFIRGTLQPGVATMLSGQASATSVAEFFPATTASADAALLVGTGTVTLPIAASARVRVAGPGNMEARFASMAGAEVSLTAATGAGNPPGGGFAGSFNSGNIVVSGPFLPVANARSQTRTAAAATVGAASTLTFDAFDPALGVLAYVTLSVTAAASGSVRLESLDTVAGSVALRQAASITVTGTNGPTLASASTAFSTTRQVSAFDGTNDFSGASATTFDGSGQGTGTGATLRGDSLNLFRSGPVALTVGRGGSTTLEAPGNLHVASTLQAGADVTLTYHFVDPVLRYTNTATGQSGTLAAEVYSGPVVQLQRQYIWSSEEGVAIATDAPDVFLRGGAGSDALAVFQGSNVLDGGGGSNFLVGTTGWDGGHDTFFVDARGGMVTWSTLVNFGPGDSATLFGFRAGTSTLPWTASDGAAGYRGLTIHSETRGAGTGVDASLTFAGADQATADSRWSITTGTLASGTTDATDYLRIEWR